MKRLFTTIFLLTTFALQSLHANNGEWFVESYGAVSDGTTLNTQAIQAAIDACHIAGGGNVVLKSGVYSSGTVILKDNVTLEIRRGAVLRGTINPQDYTCVDRFVDAVNQARGECLVGAIDAKNVGICGNGTIDGQGAYFKYELTKDRLAQSGASEQDIKSYSAVRPFLLRFVRSEGVKVESVSLLNPAAWTFHLFQCRDVKVQGISIYAHCNSNNDGIDLDSCDGVEISDCDIDTGDDAMCFKTTSPIACQNVEVKNCRLKSDWGAIKFGTESMGDFRNINVSSCEIYDTTGGGLKILSVDGANIDNVHINNITMESVDMPIFVRLGERLRTYRSAEQQSVGSINNLYIQNIKATTRSCSESRVNPPSGIVVTGTPNHKINRLVMRNIDITLPGGGSEEDAQREVPEYEKEYPEFSFFGVMPAYGMTARHIDSLQMKSITFHLSDEDKRPLTKFSDINYITNEFPALEE